MANVRGKRNAQKQHRHRASIENSERTRIAWARVRAATMANAQVDRTSLPRA